MICVERDDPEGSPKVPTVWEQRPPLGLGVGGEAVMVDESDGEAEVLGH